MTELLFLHGSDLRGLAGMDEFVDAVREGYREVGEGAPAAPRTKLTTAEPPGMLTGYLSVLPESEAMGGYVYAAGFGGGDAHFFLPLFDPESGEPYALLDGAWLNPYKTGAAGGVALDALAREDTTDIGILGASSQAKGQLRAAAAVRDLSRVAVYSRTEESREAFAAEMDAELDADVSPVGSSAEAIEGRDAVVTATNAREPVFDGDRLAPGTHVTAMGSYDADAREVDATTVARSTYVLDLRARAREDAGAFIQAKAEGAVSEDDVYGDLGAVLAGGVPGRQSDEEITLFDSGGTGIETVAAGRMLYERAVEAGVGQTLDLEPASEAME